MTPSPKDRKLQTRTAFADRKRTKNEQSFSRVIKSFTDDGEVVYGGGRGFGSNALRINGKLFAVISSKSQFVVKLPGARIHELVRSGIGDYFDPGHGRRMKEWIAIDGAHSQWIKLAKEARAYVGRKS
jgi:hypothetical protein